MIHVENLSFSYPGSDLILHNVTVDLEQGHCIALLGNNGAGKSTLLKCLNRIHDPKSGTLEMNAENILTMKRGAIARKMAYVAQQAEGDQLTVYDSVLLGRKPYITMSPKPEDYRIAEQAIERLDLKDYSLRYTAELSGGELQKVVIARALTQQPQVLLLDEPTSNLDLHNQHEVMKIASEIARDDHISVIVIIHDLNLALRYCDRFLFLKDGSVFRYGDESIVTGELLSEVYRVNASVENIRGRKVVVVE